MRISWPASSRARLTWMTIGVAAMVLAGAAVVRAHPLDPGAVPRLEVATMRSEPRWPYATGARAYADAVVHALG